MVSQMFNFQQLFTTVKQLSHEKYALKSLKLLINAAWYKLYKDCIRDTASDLSFIEQSQEYLIWWSGFIAN